MQRLRILVYAVTLLTHALVAAGFARALELAGARHAGWIAVGLAALLVLGLRGRVKRLRADRPIPAWQILLVEEPYYAHWCAALFAVPFLVVTGLGAWALGGSFGDAALAAYAFALVVSTYGVFVRRRWVRVQTLDVPIPGLDPAFDGYRIAQLSDLHIGGMCPPERWKAWVGRVNLLDVDLVALTGDYVTSGTAFHLEIAAALGAMRGRDGAFAVMGNHDYFGDGEPLVSLLRTRGVVVLRNEHRVVSRGEARLTVAGVDDTWTRRADVDRAVLGRDAAVPLVALAHDPSLFPALARRGASLVLSGHTHWGQLALPFFPTRVNLSTWSYRYHAGTYREGGATLYVNPGLGTTGPPLRLGSPPEITVVRLRTAPPPAS
jgi:predicted MPP superfamily phosphohydrolase